jgi:hypothetical protein
MYYQLDFYSDFNIFIKTIEASENNFLNNNIFFILYKSFINIDMLLERGNYLKANEEFALTQNKLGKENYFNSNEQFKGNFLLPNDISFDIKNLPKLFSLYNILVNSFINGKNSENLNEMIKELKNVKVEENMKGKNTNEIINYNNNLKVFHKYLLLKLNYLNCTSKNPNTKISYTLNKNINDLNIEGNNAVNELNKIYYYHYQGIISLKNSNYKVSTYFFLKCLQIISKKNSLQLIKRNHFYPAILFNLALSYFYSKKYTNTIKYLYLLLNYSSNKYKYFINYKYIYYRLGLSHLEILLQENQNINTLYHSYINNKFILKTPQKSSFKGNLDSIEYFKKAFILIKNNPNDPIYFSTLINIVFCLIIKENYNEAIFYLKLNKSKEINHLNIIRNYLIQCYLYLNKAELAQKISKEIIFDDKAWKSNQNNKEQKFFERLNSRLITAKGFKLNLLINMIKLCITKKNLKDINKYLISILDSVNFNISLDPEGKIDTNEEMPTYIINIFVYYYLLINRNDLALYILKKRKIKEIIISMGRK